MKTEPLNLDARKRRYDAMVSTGGIGAGRFFQLNGNHTLGREESRSGHFLDRRDYCKQHIIAHYVKALLGDSFESYPIGRLGDDETGRALHAEMLEAGLRPDFLKFAKGTPTLSCICLVYPDGDGGNLTLDGSASSKVSVKDIESAFAALERHGGRCIALAVPEVPLKARAKLLEAASRTCALRAASFLSEEMAEVRGSDLLSMVDLLALNIDEAARLADVSADGPPAGTVRRAVSAIRRAHPGLVVSITAGKAGSWLWDGVRLHFRKAAEAKLASSAGAGDAHFSGLLAGFAAGLTMEDAHALATLTGGLSVTVPHTLHKGMDRRSLAEFARQQRGPLSMSLERLLAERSERESKERRRAR